LHNKVNKNKALEIMMMIKHHSSFDEILHKILLANLLEQKEIFSNDLKNLLKQYGIDLKD